MSKISEIIRGKDLTQLEAAEILGLPPPKLSGILRGRFRGVSERKLIDCLTRLGRDVEIVVKDSPRRRAAGKLTVVFALDTICVPSSIVCLSLSPLAAAAPERRLRLAEVHR
jgi:transcriptional regulator with XRE-family HTH domain